MKEKIKRELIRAFEALVSAIITVGVFTLFKLFLNSIKGTDLEKVLNVVAIVTLAIVFIFCVISDKKKSTRD